MLTICKTFRFSAAHSLAGIVPDDHKCARLHGHNYKVSIEVADDALDNMVVDFMWIDYVWARVASMVDHRNLNDVMDVPTTSENLCRWIYRKLMDDKSTEKITSKITAIRVSETDETWAEYRPGQKMTSPTA